MTREEAIELLEDLDGAIEDNQGRDYDEAFHMAIEALKDRPTGEWIDKGEYAECSMCGAHSGTQFDGVEPIPLKTSYCPNCGARMKGGAE